MMSTVLYTVLYNTFHIECIRLHNVICSYDHGLPGCNYNTTCLADYIVNEIEDKNKLRYLTL